MAKKSPSPKTVATLTHDADKRKKILSAEKQSTIQKEVEQPKKVRPLRNTDFEPQLVWRGKEGRADHITREPKQIKGFRDTWRNGIHSYLSYTSLN